jgi:hypothetical protein
MNKLTNREIEYADRLVAENLPFCGALTLDQLIDKWADHGYRPTLRTDLGYAQLADAYDRRAAERGIDVRAYRG